jgi:hypothetical protein
MKSILDPSFRYVPAAHTDLRATFRRIRRELAAARAEERAKVQPITKREARK